jgi:hypothetical protein
MKFLAILLITAITSVHAFWDGNNTNWSPFGAGTGYNNQAPWGDNSNWNPFSATDARWSPKNDAANLSRYGNRPPVLMQYKKDPRFQPSYLVRPSFQNRIKPSNWLTETDFASTLIDMGEHNKDFFVDDNFSPLDLPKSYLRAKSESVGINKMLRDRAPLAPYKNGATDNIYGKQGYGLSPAASSTNWMNE